MKRRVLSALVCVLAAPATLFAAPARSECLPPFTETIGKNPDPALIMAGGPAPIAVRIAGPFDVPWSVAALPDGAFLVTERPGRLKLVQPGVETHEIFGVPPVYYSGHGGLLDVAIDPQFDSNNLVYFSYLQGDQAGSILRVMRARLDVSRNRLTEQEVIFEGTRAAKPEMLGARLALSADGYLFLSSGDRWEADLPRIFRILQARSSASARTAACPTTILSDSAKGSGPRFGATGTAIRKGFHWTPRPASSGRRSTDRKAGTSSTMSFALAITGGLSPPTVSIIQDGHSE